MKCTQARHLLSASLDNDLTFEEQSLLDEHLGVCAECGAEMRNLAAIRDFMCAMPEVEPSAGFYEQIKDKIGAAENQNIPVMEPAAFSLSEYLRNVWQSAWLRPAMGAALGLVVGILISTGQPGTGPGGNMSSMADGNPVGDLSGTEAFADANQGPFSEIVLPPLHADADSLQMDEEYVLEPYVQDPNLGLVPMGDIGSHQVSSDRNTQSGVKIIF